MKATVVTEL